MRLSPERIHWVITEECHETGLGMISMRNGINTQLQSIRGSACRTSREAHATRHRFLHGSTVNPNVDGTWSGILYLDVLGHEGDPWIG